MGQLGSMLGAGGARALEATLEKIISDVAAENEFQMYKLVNYRRGGSIMESCAASGTAGVGIREVERICREVLLNYVYDKGRGRTITTDDCLAWRRRLRKEVAIPVSRVRKIKPPPSKDRGVKNNVAAVDGVAFKNSVLSPSRPYDTPLDHEGCWMLEQRGALGENPLHVLVICDTPTHTRVAKIILSHYPKLVNDIMEGTEYYGLSPLHLAVAYNNMELVQAFVAAGAHVNERAVGKFFMPSDQKDRPKRKTNYEGLSYLGEYPLSWAACCENEAIYNYLLDRGSDPNLQDSFGNMILHMVVISNKLGMYGYALRHPKRPANNEIVNRAGLTPLTLACVLGRNNIFREMLELSSVEFWRFSNITCSAYPLIALDTIRPDGGTNWKSALMIILDGETQEHLDMLEGGVIQRLLEDKWKTYARNQFLKRLGFLFLHLVVISIAVYLRPPFEDSLKWSSDVKSIVRHCAEFGSLLGCGLFVFVQQGSEIVSQGFVEFGTNLLRSPAKFIFLVSNICILICIPCRLLSMRLVEDSLLTFALPGTWFFLMFFAGAVRLTGPFVTMIYSMIAGDMVRFGIIYLIMLLGFSQAFYFLFKSCHVGVREADDTNIDLYETFIGTWMALYQMTLGNYQYSDFSKPKYSGLSLTIFVIFMVLVPILLLNMLIAMMGNTYANVISKSEKEFVKQWAKIVLALERSINKKSCKEHLNTYGINLGPPPSDGSEPMKGLMVIKSKNKTKAQQRKGALLNWRRVGKKIVGEMRKYGCKGDQLLQTKSQELAKKGIRRGSFPALFTDNVEGGDDEQAQVPRGGLGEALSQLAFAHDIDITGGVSDTPPSTTPVPNTLTPVDPNSNAPMTSIHPPQLLIQNPQFSQNSNQMNPSVQTSNTQPLYPTIPTSNQTNFSPNMPNPTYPPQQTLNPPCPLQQPINPAVTMNQPLNPALLSRQSFNTAPIMPQPSHPATTVSQPLNPAFLSQQSFNPAPIMPQPLNPVPIMPQPLNPAPIMPQPLNPAPIMPQPLNPAPIMPQPLNPALLSQQSFNPAPIMPQPMNPASSVHQSLNPAIISQQQFNSAPITPLSSNSTGPYPQLLNPAAPLTQSSNPTDSSTQSAQTFDLANPTTSSAHIYNNFNTASQSVNTVPVPLSSAAFYPQAAPTHQPITLSGQNVSSHLETVTSQSQLPEQVNTTSNYASDQLAPISDSNLSGGRENENLVSQQHQSQPNQNLNQAGYGVIETADNASNLKDNIDDLSSASNNHTSENQGYGGPTQFSTMHPNLPNSAPVEASVPVCQKTETSPQLPLPQNIPPSGDTDECTPIPDQVNSASRSPQGQDNAAQPPSKLGSRGNSFLDEKSNGAHAPPRNSTPPCRHICNAGPENVTSPTANLPIAQTLPPMEIKTTANPRTGDTVAKRVSLSLDDKRPPSYEEVIEKKQSPSKTPDKSAARQNNLPSYDNAVGGRYKSLEKDGTTSAEQDNSKSATQLDTENQKTDANDKQRKTTTTTESPQKHNFGKKPSPEKQVGAVKVADVSPKKMIKDVRPPSTERRDESATLQPSELRGVSVDPAAATEATHPLLGELLTVPSDLVGTDGQRVSGAVAGGCSASSPGISHKYRHLRMGSGRRSTGGGKPKRNKGRSMSRLGKLSNKVGVLQPPSTGSQMPLFLQGGRPESVFVPDGGQAVGGFLGEASLFTVDDAGLPVAMSTLRGYRATLPRIQPAPGGVTFSSSAVPRTPSATETPSEVSHPLNRWSTNSIVAMSSLVDWDDGSDLLNDDMDNAPCRLGTPTDLNDDPL